MKEVIRPLVVAVATIFSLIAQDQTGQSTLVELGTGAVPVNEPTLALGTPGKQFAAYVKNAQIVFERSLDNGETFGPAVPLGIGFHPCVVWSPSLLCVCWYDQFSGTPAQPAVVLRVSTDDGATFAPAERVTSVLGAKQSLEAHLDASNPATPILRVAWHNSGSGTNGIYFREVDLSVSPVVPGEIQVSSGTLPGVTHLDFAVDSVNSYLIWRRGAPVYGAVKAHVSAIWPAETPLWSGAPAGADVVVAGSQGVGVFCWVSAVPSFASEVLCQRWVAGAWAVGPQTLMPTNPPTLPYAHDGLSACASGASFYVAAGRNQNAVFIGAPSQTRVLVARSANAGASWSLTTADTDPLGTPPYGVADLDIECEPDPNGNRVGVLWQRSVTTLTPTNSLRFLKSLDGGATWLASCGGDPACAEPIYLALATGQTDLHMDSHSAVATYAIGFSPPFPQGMHSHMIAGHQRYDVCDTSVPAICGGAPGTDIRGLGIPWTDAAPSSPTTTVIEVSSPLPIWILVFTLAGRAANPSPQVFGIVPHIDVATFGIWTSGVGTVGSVPVAIPDSSAISSFDLRAYFQGVFWDGVNPFLWSNGLELRVN